MILHRKKIIILYFLFCSFLFLNAQNEIIKYVDPVIGSDPYHGMTIIGPSLPFGMVKPGPDCHLSSNTGYTNLELLPTLFGFSQVHNSGTGGGPKYGNILVMPFSSDFNSIKHTDVRTSEDTELGYYSTQLMQSKVNVEITCSQSVSFYTFNFEQDNEHGISIDAGSFLGEKSIPDSREAQQLVGSETQVLSDSSVCGYTRLRGGWNNGTAYTVYYYAVFDQPFNDFSTWKGKQIENKKNNQFDSGEKTGAILKFNSDQKEIHLKIGISFVSSLKAQHNIEKEVPDWSFDKTLNENQQTWAKLLSRIQIEDESTSEDYKKMFYTALYHTMLMPVNRNGENPLWNNKPYYDDFYTIWDTYRTMNPLLTIIDPMREVEILNAMINIYKYDGYLPEGRSGNCNGRTQGGSNAEIVFADALSKNLKGVDYGTALKAMIKDATIPPGGNEEKEGRGGLSDYNTLGYVSNRFVRAGNRTLDYSYDDYCLAQVAKNLNRKEEYHRFIKQADNWQNLWRDTKDHGSQGFIMPKDENGNWVDSIPCVIENGRRSYTNYNPLSREWPNCVCWWCGFFYEGDSWEYSFSVPHDVSKLVEKCGGKDAFIKRLNTFFDNKYYNPNNEPSFLTPCLYHWAGRPDLSNDRVHSIIKDNFNASQSGIPGADDSGAMSSWLAFHMMGFYPNAGQPYYLLTAPFFKKVVIHLQNGKTFNIEAPALSEKNKYIKSVTLNGKPLNKAWINHSDIENGGTLIFNMASKRNTEWGNEELPPSLSEN